MCTCKNSWRITLPSLALPDYSIPWTKQQNASEESEDISCSWLISQILKPEKQAISAQYSKQASLAIHTKFKSHQ